MEDIRVIFMGTPVFACAILETLIKNKYNVVAVVSQPDRMVGRKKVLAMTPVKKLALEHGIEVIQVESIKDDYEKVLSLQPDLIVTCAYGQFIPSAVLDYPKYGCLNVHASLLPKLRGGAPIHKAIIYGHQETGVTLMQMIKKMDAGDMYASAKIKIADDDTTATLHDKLMVLGANLLAEKLPEILSGKIKPVKQNETEATFAYAITREEEKVDFSCSCRNIYNQIRGLLSWPGCYALLDGKQVKFWEVKLLQEFSNDNHESGKVIAFDDDMFIIKAGSGQIGISVLQLEGKQKMSAKDFYLGNKDFVGKKLN